MCIIRILTIQCNVRICNFNVDHLLVSLSPRPREHTSKIWTLQRKHISFYTFIGVTFKLLYKPCRAWLNNQDTGGPTRNSSSECELTKQNYFRKLVIIKLASRNDTFLLQKKLKQNHKRSNRKCLQKDSTKMINESIIKSICDVGGGHGQERSRA